MHRKRVVNITGLSNDHVKDQKGARNWAAFSKANGGGEHKNVYYLGETGIVNRGYTDKNPETSPYQLNADGTATQLEYGKPTTTKVDPANTEPSSEGERETPGSTGAKDAVDAFVDNVAAPAVTISKELVKSDLSVSKGAKVRLQTTGAVLSVYSAVNNINDYQNGKISGAHLTVNLIMNGVGFLGPIGAGISLLYGFTESWWW